MNSPKIAAISFAAAMLIGFGGWWGYSAHEESQLRARLAQERQQKAEHLSKLAPLLKNATLRLNDALAIERGGYPGITYGEAFKKLEEHISEVDKRKIEVQMFDNTTIRDGGRAALSYIEHTGSTLRAQLALNRKQADVVSRQNAVSSHFDRKGGYSGWMEETYRLEKAAHESRLELTHSIIRFATSLEDMVAVRGSAAAFFDTATLCDEATLKQVRSGLEASRAQNNRELSGLESAMISTQRYLQKRAQR